MAFDIFSKNGVLLPIAEAVVPLSSIEYAYGFGVYETLRVKNGKPVFLSDHIARLGISAEIIGLEHPFSKEVIEGFVNDLVSKTETQTYNLKILLIGASKMEDAAIYIMCSNPLFPDKKLYRDGAELTAVNGERIYPHAKSLNMLESYIAYRVARQKNAYDALLVNRDGNITEGTRTNFFAIKDKIIYSAPEAEILLGVTRKNILDIALKNGYEIQDAHIKLDDLKNYDGAFITSTSTKILPVRKIDDFEYPSIPEALTNLIDLFDKFLEQGN